MQVHTTLKFIINSFKPFKWWIFCQLLVGSVWAIDLSLRPYLLKLMLDKIPSLTPENTVSQLYSPASLYIGMTLLITIVFRIHDIIWLNINLPIQRHVGKQLVTRVMQHAQEVLQTHFAGNLGNRIKEVMSDIPDLLKLVIEGFFSHTLSLVIAIFTLWRVNKQFGIVLICWIAIFIFVSLLFASKAKLLTNFAAAARSQVVGQIVDILNNIFVVRLFAASSFEGRRLTTRLDQHVAAGQKRDWFFLWIALVQSVSFVVYQALSMVLLVVGFKHGMVTPGDFMLILTINIGIIHVLRSLSEDISRAAKLLGNISQGLSIAFMPLTVQDHPGAGKLQVTKGEILFEHVRFQYKKTAPLFHDKSVKLCAGQKIGLVGYSGSGKSTFINLILRLYDVTKGSILIDDQNIQEVTQDSLRSSISMIPQDPVLFHRSLKENIRYGRLDATDEEVIAAAKKAYAHDFIMKLPQAYESMVGERGIKLSGGQRQRIAIARAVLKNSPILIMDEATSQLDSVTEKAIQRSLWELMQGKTSIVIAHRLSTLLQMDRILVFNSGRIVEDGSHEELIMRPGLYKTLWDTQIGGVLKDYTHEEDEFSSPISIMDIEDSIIDNEIF